MRAGALDLDGALERVSALEFPPTLHYVSHAPMACEALCALGHEERLVDWVPHFERQLVAAPAPVAPPAAFARTWQEWLGDRRRLPEWIGLFERSIDDEGWEAVVGTWAPRLSPALASALYHGAIRTAHAVRSVGASDTPARRAELARALGSWASWYHPGAPARTDPEDAAVRDAIVDAARDGAGCYVADPTIAYLHGVTGAIALARLSDHVPHAAGLAALAQLRADHADLYGDTDPAVLGDAGGEGWDEAVVKAAADGVDAHEIKMVDACKEGYDRTGDPIFVVAARTVTGLG